MKTTFNLRRLLPLTVLIAFGGCMTILGDRPTMGMRTPPVAPPYLGTFDKLWFARTVQLAQESEGQGTPFLPAGGDEPARGGSGPLPVIVRATYVDSALIEEGLRAFAGLASMNDDERSQFRTGYRAARSSGDSLFIWLELQTSATEDFLQLDRWTLFLENEDGAQFEPGRIVDHPAQRMGRRAPASDDTRLEGSELSGFGSTVKKEVELYFRRIPAGSGTRTGSAAHTLRFILFETKNPLVREEGAWQISGSSVSRVSK